MQYRMFTDVFDVMRYPAGEPHVEARYLPQGEDTVLVVPGVRNFDDLGIMITANEILAHNGVSRPKWFIPYFPFGRHDRRRHARDGLELNLALRMVAHMDVVTLDPHSDVLGQMRHISQAEVVLHLRDYTDIFAHERTVVVIPDAGAAKKAYEWLPYVKPKAVCQGHKKRDPATGQLSGFGVDNPLALGDAHVVIVDDICDAGGTFLGLAEVLKQYHPDSLTLFVTHGLFTKGTDQLTDTFNRVVTTTYPGETRPKVEWVRPRGIYERASQT